MTEIRKIFMIITCIVLILLVGNIFRCRYKENLIPKADEDASAFDYLNQYEQQDEWKNSAMDRMDPVWPVAQIPAAANYEIRRKIGMSSSY